MRFSSQRGVILELDRVHKTEFNYFSVDDFLSTPEDKPYSGSYTILEYNKVSFKYYKADKECDLIVENTIDKLQPVFIIMESDKAEKFINSLLNNKDVERVDCVEFDTDGRFPTLDCF